MRDSKRAVNSVAVFCRWRRWVRSVDDVVTGVAKVIGAPAAVEGDRAAIHALPVNLVITVFRALRRARANLRQETILAKQVLLPCLLLLCSSHLLLAVHKATEVRLLAFVALEERASVQGVLQRLFEVKIVRILQTVFLQDSLLLCIAQGLSLDYLFDADDRTQGSCNRPGQSALQPDFLLALGTGHEGERDFQGCPGVLKKFNHAVRVEDVATW